MLRTRDDEGDDAECLPSGEREFFLNRLGKAKIAETSSRAKTKEFGWATVGKRMKYSSKPRQKSLKLSLTDAEVGSRWDADLIKNMQDTPRQPDPTRPGVGIPIKVRFSEPAHVDDAIPNQPAWQEHGPTRMRIMPYMLEKKGFTKGCEGCRHKQAGLQGGWEESQKMEHREVLDHGRRHDGGEGSAAVMMLGTAQTSIWV